MCFKCLFKFSTCSPFPWLLLHHHSTRDFKQRVQHLVSRAVFIILTTQTVERRKEVFKSISRWFGCDLTQSSIKLFDFFSSYSSSSFLNVWKTQKITRVMLQPPIVRRRKTNTRSHYLMVRSVLQTLRWTNVYFCWTEKNHKRKFVMKIDNKQRGVGDH